MTIRPLHVCAALIALALGATGVACTTEQDYSALPTEVPTNGPTTTVALASSIPPCVDDPGAAADGSTPSVGDEAPAGSAPGDLIAATKLGPGEKDDQFPTDAIVWRVLYVSTGVDESDLQLVCGVAAAPSGGPTAEGGTGHLLAWAHGTIGLQQNCLPSRIPGTTFWGPMSSGLGAVAWGTGRNARKGDAADGALQTALDRGWVVSATDYQPNDTYIMGRIAAANVIDAARATTQLMDQEFGAASTPDRYDAISWGHSQGGHAALWAGQLFESYQAGTPNPRSAPLTLRGVAAEAPAANLLAQPDLQPGVELGDGLADWEMHKSIELFGLPIPFLQLQIGPALFSYIFGSWTQFSHRGEPATGSEFPAYPSNASELDLDAVATDEGALTIARTMALCLDKADSGTVKSLVAPYRNAEKHAMLTPELWNLPTEYRAGRFFKGGVDRTCAEPQNAGSADAASETADSAADLEGMAAWCRWIRWNTPGPLGEHPFAKVPTTDGAPVPVLIAQGSDDEIIHCSPSDGGSSAVVPPPSDCMSSALFESMRDDAYCPAAGDVGHLELAIYRQDGSGSPASHLSIPGQIAATGDSEDTSDLRFDGSPLDEFMTGSFAGTLTAGCTAKVLNP